MSLINSLLRLDYVPFRQKEIAEEEALVFDNLVLSYRNHIMYVNKGVITRS